MAHSTIEIEIFSAINKIKMNTLMALTFQTTTWMR
jgi:hypothetical protein